MKIQVFHVCERSVVAIILSRIPSHLLSFENFSQQTDLLNGSSFFSTYF